MDGDPWTRVAWADGRETQAGETLDREASAALFARRGDIARIDVGVEQAALLA